MVHAPAAIRRLLETDSIDPELKQFLTDAGYYGGSAKCQRYKLIGVQRPGWVQVFEIELKVKRQEGDWEDKLALCTTDERDGTYQIQLFDDREACREAGLQATAGMIVQGRGENHPVKSALLLLFTFALMIAIVGAVLTLVGIVQPPAGG